MNIIDKRKEVTGLTFEELNIGDYFEFIGNTNPIYIKTANVYVTGCTLRYNAVNLTTGEYIFFDKDREVTKLNVDIVIKNNL